MSQLFDTAGVTPPRIKIIVDTREQLAWEFPQAVVEIRKLDVGDYALADYLDLAIERKTLDDFCQSIGKNRARFAREYERAQESQTMLVCIIEGSWEDVLDHNYISHIHTHSVIGTVYLWQKKYGMPIYLAGNRMIANELAWKMLKLHYKRANALRRIRNGRQSNTSVEKG